MDIIKLLLRRRLIKKLAARCTQNAKGRRNSARVLAHNSRKRSLIINFNNVRTEKVGRSYLYLTKA